METKKCSSCFEEKQISDFYFHPSKKRYLCKCRACTSAEKLMHKHKNLENYKRIRNLWTKKIRYECIVHYGGKCACCNESNLEFLVIDHIHGNGNKERNKNTHGSGGWKFAEWLKKQNYPKGYRVLCHNCNSALGFYGYCPHEKESNRVSNY